MIWVRNHWIWLVGAGLLLALYLYLVFRPQELTVSHYEVAAKVAAPLRIVQLSDLHSAEFGPENDDLVELVAAQEPDLIAMTGDMLSRFDKSYDVVTALISRLTEIAPVYYGLGNHEVTWQYADASLAEVFTKAGATVLECEYADVEIKGVPLRIGGFFGYYGFTHMSGETEERKQVEQRFFDTFTKTKRYKILLNHIPTQWLDWHHLDEWNQDLIFSGHYHGGQIYLPLLNRGLIAPYVGFFPKYTKGCFVGQQGTCVLSAGLGNEYWLVPRINNPPELVVVDLIPE